MPNAQPYTAYEIVALSHDDVAKDKNGAPVQLREGMVVTAFEEDSNERGERDDLVAQGVVERSPEWLQCKGSRWSLRLDEHGVRHQSEVPE